MVAEITQAYELIITDIPSVHHIGGRIFNISTAVPRTSKVIENKSP